MRKQLIINIPESATSGEISSVANMISESYASGYPIYLFPGWKYDVVEVSEPMIIINNSKTNKEEFIKAMKEAKLRVVTE